MMRIKDILNVGLFSEYAFYGQVTLMLISFWALGSATAQTDKGQHPFDVASVKLSNGAAGMMWDCSQLRLNATAISVDWMIQRAYEIYPFQVTKVPKWSNGELFDVQAKVIEPNGDTVPVNKMVRDCNRVGVQALLADRFHLRYHWEHKDQPVYALLLDKEARLPKRSSSSERNGVIGHGKIRMTGVTMDDLANFLSSDLQRTVLNQTGISGRFDIELRWSPELEEEPDESAPSLFTALKEQLGLRLDAQRALGKVFVVDQLQRPSAN